MRREIHRKRVQVSFQKFHIFVFVRAVAVLFSRHVGGYRKFGSSRRECIGGERRFYLLAAVYLSFSVQRGGVAVRAPLLAACAVFIPMLLGFTEKHMRIGSRSYKGIAGRLNTNFLPTLVVLVLFMLVYELWALLAAGLVYAVTLLLDGTACFVLAIAVLLGANALLAWFASAFLLWLPCMQITGYSYIDSLNFSGQLYARRRGKLFLAVFLPLLAGVVLQFAIVAASPLEALRIPAYVFLELVYLFLFLYYCILMYVAYFDAAGEERMDLAKKYG